MHSVLNEVVMDRGAYPGAVLLEIYVDGTFVTTGQNYLPHYMFIVCVMAASVVTNTCPATCFIVHIVCMFVCDEWPL